VREPDETARGQAEHPLDGQLNTAAHVDFPPAFPPTNAIRIARR
jgi:hypothetical protein